MLLPSLNRHDEKRRWGVQVRALAGQMYYGMRKFPSPAGSKIDNRFAMLNNKRIF